MPGIDLLGTVGLRSSTDNAANTVAIVVHEESTSHNELINPFDDVPESSFDDRENMMNTCMTAYDNIRLEIAKLEHLTVEVEEATARHRRATNHDDQKQIMQDVDGAVSQSRAVTSAVRNVLQEQKEDNDSFSRKSPGSSVAQWRINQINALAKRFRAAATEFEESLREYRETLRLSQKRQIQIVNVDNALTEEEIDAIAEDTGRAAQYIQASLAMGVDQEFLAHLTELEDRLAGMERIEQSVRELHQMWNEFQLLVDHQGEMLDNIESNVRETKKYIGETVPILVDAEKHQTCARKQLCWLLCCFVIILALVFGWLFRPGGAMQSA